MKRDLSEVQAQREVKRETMLAAILAMREAVKANVLPAYVLFPFIESLKDIEAEYLRVFVETTEACNE